MKQIKKIFGSEQFLYAAGEVATGFVIAFIALLITWITGAITDQAFLVGTLALLGPILKRLQSGIQDARRNLKGKVLSRDVSANP